MELRQKQRLIGAFVLVNLIVVQLPFVFYRHKHLNPPTAPTSVALEAVKPAVSPKTVLTQTESAPLQVKPIPKKMGSLRVGVFANADHATQLMNKLKTHGYPVFSKVIPGQHPFTAVFIGPKTVDALKVDQNTVLKLYSLQGLIKQNVS